MRLLMHLFKIYDLSILCYYTFTPYRNIISHLIYYKYYINKYAFGGDLASLKISRRYNDELIYKARLCKFNYLHSLPYSIERTQFYNELTINFNKIKGLYNHYNRLIETFLICHPDSSNYLKNVIDELKNVIDEIYNILK